MLKHTPTLLSASLLLLAIVGQSCRKETEAPLSSSSQSSADATVADYTAYTLQNQISNKFLEVAGDTLQNQKYADGALLRQASALPTGTNGTWQQWSLVYRTSVGSTRYYQLRNMFSGKLLTSPSSTAGDQLVQQGEVTTLSDQQLWQVSKVDSTGTSRYRLINKANNLVVTNHNASKTEGSAITQETLVLTQWRQRWAFAGQAVQSYRDDQVTHFFERNDRSQGSVAFDGGVSIPLSDGRVFWATSDGYDGQSLVSNTSHLLKDNNYIAYRNTALVQPTAANWSNDAPNLTNSSIPNNWTTWYARQIFNAPTAVYPSGTFAWPYAGIEIGSHVYVQASEGNLAADAATRSQLGQTGQAIYDLTETAGTNWAPPVRIVPNGFGPSTTPCAYGAGMVKGADGYVYTYGASYNLGDNIYVARFKANADSVRTGWRYWNGTGWAKTPSKSPAAIVGKAVSSTSVNYVNGKYVAVSMDVSYDCASGKPGIYVATSSSPTGPFINQHKVYSIAEYQYGKRARVYVLHTHPQAVNGHNELLITYSMNFNDGGCAVASPSGLRDPYFSRLKGVRVPYSLIGL